MRSFADFDDDEEDEGFDSVDEEPVERPRARKKKKRKVATLLDIEAEEDDADDDDDEDEADMRQLIADDQDEDVDREREQMRAQRFEQRRMLNAEDPAEMERYYREKFGEGVYDEDDATNAPDTAGIDQQSLLPTIRDPRLWIVKCTRPGHEKRAIFSLLQKAFNMRKKGQEIGIFSAIAPDQLKGVIYVEAFSAAQVEVAIHGLQLFTAYGGIKALKLEEMPDALKAAKRPDKQEPGNWVRITRGIYKGDLAQVAGIREGAGEGQLMIRMIPRLDVKVEKDYIEGIENAQNDEEGERSDQTRRKGRPPQKLFSKKELYKLTGSADVYSQKDSQTGEVFQVWNQQLFRHGLFYKRMSEKTLITGAAVQPQLDELDRWLMAEKLMRKAFKDDPSTMDVHEAEKGLMLDLRPFKGSRNAKLAKGDSVRVTGGEQKGVTGKIAAFDGDVVHIKIPQFPDPVRVSRADVSKEFNVGDHVKVASGKKAGYAGSIVKVDGDVLTLFTDATNEEITVLSTQVADSSDIHALMSSQKVSAVQQKMQYELFDLVQLLADKSEVGVVIHAQGERVSLLTAQNTTKTVPIGAIKGKMKDTRARGRDSRGNPIAPNDSIHVISGPLRDRQGTVKHVAGSTVFFKARDEIKNCGMLAIIARDCIASTAAARTLTFTHGSGNNSRFKMPAPIPKGSMASFGSRGRASSGRDPLLRKDVKIRAGQYKGHTGRVVDTTENTVRVELSSKMKTITISKSKVRDLSDPNGSSSRPSGSSLSRGPGAGSSLMGANRRMPPPRTTNFPAQTPHRAQFPARTPQADRFATTPRMGSATPRMGSMTPAHTAYGSMTPARDDFRGNRTPARADDYGTPFSMTQRPTMPQTPAAEMANPYSNPPHTPATPAPVPQTPLGGSFGVMEPRTPANIIEPNTPAYGIEPRTPAPGMEPTTPAPGLEPRTPAPGMEPTTPAPGLEPSTPMVQEPATPHTPGIIPQTPLGNEEEVAQPAEVGYQVLVGVEVLVGAENNNAGVVIQSSPDGGSIQVKMVNGPRPGSIVDVGGKDITPVQPRADVPGNQEVVKVLDGHYAGKRGRLLKVSGDLAESLEGTIKFTDGQEVTLMMSLMAKCGAANIG